MTPTGSLSAAELLALVFFAARFFLRLSTGFVVFFVLAFFTRFLAFFNYRAKRDGEVTFAD
jgi:hypothetical protein